MVRHRCLMAVTIGLWGHGPLAPLPQRQRRPLTDKPWREAAIVTDPDVTALLYGNRWLRGARAGPAIPVRHRRLGISTGCRRGSI